MVPQNKSCTSENTAESLESPCPNTREVSQQKLIDYHLSKRIDFVVASELDDFRDQKGVTLAESAILTVSWSPSQSPSQNLSLILRTMCLSPNQSRLTMITRTLIYSSPVNDESGCDAITKLLTSSSSQSFCSFLAPSPSLYSPISYSQYPSFS